MTRDLSSLNCEPAPHGYCDPTLVSATTCRYLAGMATAERGVALINPAVVDESNPQDLRERDVQAENREFALRGLGGEEYDRAAAVIDELQSRRRDALRRAMGI